MTKRILYILIGAIVVVLIAVGVGVFVLLPKITSANSPQATPTPVATTKTKTKQTTEAGIVKEYGPDIRNQIAQGLHLTPEQLTTELRSGQTLDQIATTQGVSSTQLTTLISSSVTSGLQPAVTAGTLTQKQVDNLVKRYEKNHTPLEKLLSVIKTSKNKTATPTPTTAG